MEQPVEDEACELIAPDAVSFDCATDDNDASIPSFVYPKRKNQEVRCSIMAVLLLLFCLHCVTVLLVIETVFTRYSGALLRQ